MRGAKPMGYGHAATGLAAIMAAAMAWTAYANEPDAPPPVRPTGYLGAERIPDEKLVLANPPADKSISGKADLAIFRVTRKASGSDRWELALRDNAVDPASLLDTFGCALNARLKPGDSPAFDRLMRRVMADAGLIIGPSKDRHERPRPFLRAKGKVCIDMTPSFASSGSYPSGHSTVGWLYGLILSEMAPDRASQLIERGRVFGESRIVCGVHYASDVNAGVVAATSLMAALHTDAEFESDLAAARAEFAALRPQLPAPDGPRCDFERKAIAATPDL